MNIGQQILFLVSALGAFNGFILGFYLFFNKKRRSLASIFLGILLVAFSIRVTKSVFLYFNPALPKICLQIGLSACFLIGPSLYYFFRSVLDKRNYIPDSWKWSWGIQLGMLLLIGFLFPYATHPEIWNQIVVYVIYAQWLLYVVATGFFLKPFVVKRPPFLLMLYLGNCIIFLVYQAALFRLLPGIYQRPYFLHLHAADHYFL